MENEVETRVSIGNHRATTGFRSSITYPQASKSPSGISPPLKNTHPGKEYSL